MSPTTPGKPVVYTIRPMLAVTDLARTIRFYVERLGFTCNSLFGEPPVWCDLDRNGQSMMFNAPPREEVVRDVPRRSKDYQILYFNVTDVVGLRAEFAARGVSVSVLHVTVYGTNEFEIRDPDDYWLWFGESMDEPATAQE